MLTLHDIKEKLKRLDEVMILEVLGLSSEDIVERFEDEIEERFEQLAEDLKDV